MIVIKYKDGKIETIGSSTPIAWFASKLKKNGGIEECYDVILDESFIEAHFEELKGILEEYKIKLEDNTK